MMTSTLPLRTLGSAASLLAATLYNGNHNRNHKFWNIDLYSICKSSGNIATYIRKINNWNIGIISFVVSFRSMSISMCISMHEADLAVSLIFFKLNEIDEINIITKVGMSYWLLCEKTSSIWRYVKIKGRASLFSFFLAKPRHDICLKRIKKQVD
jgi:hypothetical protein